MSQFQKAFGKCWGPLDFPMQDDDARDLEKRMESGEWSPFRLQKGDAIETFSANDTRQDVSVITDSSVDKEGDVIDPDSIDFTHFRKNPVVAYNHKYDLPPVGKSLWQKKVTGVWKAKTEYYDRPKDHPEKQEWFPSSIWHMIKSGGMRGKSIGGAVKWKEPTQEDADRLRFDLNKAKRISEKVELWEYSVCPIAINSNAVVEAISKGQLSVTDVRQMAAIGDIEIDLEQFKEPEMPIIKSFKTADQYLSDRRAYQNNQLEKLREQLPKMIEDCFKRLTGKVM